MITLKHGTSSYAAQKILTQGLNAGACLTDCDDVAEYYAEEAMEACEHSSDDYVILEVRVSPESLRPDYNAYAEPLTLYRNDYATSDREWDEGVNDGTIPSPSDERDYKTALDVVRCVVHTTHIPPNNISLSE